MPAAEGVDVVLVARTAADLAAVRVKIVGERNVAVGYYAIDLCDSKNVDRLAAECADIDILVNHAGAILGGNIRAGRRGRAGARLETSENAEIAEIEPLPIAH